ncbi:MAG: DNA-directed RNA polymerase subunit beta, partial [Candidatus Sumerlaeaceae bacterium]|nr:DNA-directed RNA polymerase subunit beta [Candidatus Sumerlaeaceae bacterium]
MARAASRQSAASENRHSFARIPEIMEIPYLLETQKKSYEEFLQFNIPPDMRQNAGLQEAFTSIFPVTSPSTPSTLEFVEYAFGAPKYNVKECMDRGMTYAAPLKVKLQLIVRETNPETNITEIKDIKEQEVYMGEVPLMTEQGTFIVNGAERVIVSQLHRSPGVSFSSAVHPNGKTTYSARVIPYRGAWVEFEVDINNVMYVMVDRKRKIPATTFLRCFNVSDDERIAKEFFETEKLELDDFSKGAIKVSDLIEKFLGNQFIEEITDPKSGKVLVAKGAKVTKKASEALRVHGVSHVHLDVADGYDHVLGRRLGRDVVDKATGEIIGDCFEKITTTLLRRFSLAGVKSIELLVAKEDEPNVVLSTLSKDKVKTIEESLIEFFKRMRPGNPLSLQSARRLFEDMFYTEKRYDLGAVGRYKMNRRFKLADSAGRRTLSVEDIVGIMKALAKIAQEDLEIDDIDHLGNRRVRSVGELLQNQVRAGLAEMEKTARERMAIVDLENLLPHNLINAKPLVSATKDFFGRSQLSQFMDQTNPLSELTHKRRLSALGPGGLSRDRAGFEVRDVHHTHYGRICPIETPEGPNIGLISSLSTYARINEFGFIESPYRKVSKGKVSEEIEYMTADFEDEHTVAQANAPLDEKNNLTGDTVLARLRGDFPKAEPDKVNYMDVSPKQLVSVSAALIPFLEHDDANRALMGSNMQRQAVPLLYTDSPVVGTGMEGKCAIDSGACVTAKRAGEVIRSTATEIAVKTSSGQVDSYSLIKYKRSNQNTCMNQHPVVTEGTKVAAGQVLADGPAIQDGELALGKNLMVAFMPFGGFNFEDAILISERVVKEDVYTSIHIEEFEVDARDTKLGKEEITRDIPNVSEEALAKLDESGLILVGSEVKPGDILVGKVTPKGETELTAEEKLLRAIFGEKAGDVRDASLKVPPGTYGTVVDIKTFSRKERGGKSEKEDKNRIAEIEKERDADLENAEAEFSERLRELLGKIEKPVINFETGQVELKVGQKVSENSLTYVKRSLRTGMLPVEGHVGSDIKRLYQKHAAKVTEIDEISRNKIDRIKTGDELPPGVIKLCKVYVATKRKLQVGDKMAGRHGNKGVVARIQPEEDMPFLADGTPVDIVLNPLGVPSRMNVGQILETHLGWAGQALGIKVATPVFDGAKEEEIRDMLVKAREAKMAAAGDTRKYANLSEAERMLDVNHTGQVTLFDGATGEAFDRPVTVGCMYMLKLAHLVDDKMHARSIGPYSLVTQQPLGGKAQFGGQRFGEMEVWALEAYGSAYTLQELLTVKSDDVAGRTKIYESIIKGENHLQPGIPESFNVLVKELQGLGLNMELLTEDESIPTSEDDEHPFEAILSHVDDEDIFASRGG